MAFKNGIQKWKHFFVVLQQLRFWEHFQTNNLCSTYTIWIGIHSISKPILMDSPHSQDQKPLYLKISCMKWLFFLWVVILFANVNQPPPPYTFILYVPKVRTKNMLVQTIFPLNMSLTMVEEKVPSKPIYVPKLFHPGWLSIRPNL